MKRISFLIFVVGFLMACAKEMAHDQIENHDTNGIVNGEPVVAADPFVKRVVGLWVRRSSGQWFICTAAPVSEKVLLTAAHCMRDAQKTVVLFGLHQNDRSSCKGLSKCEMVATKVISHPQYDPNILPSLYDVALIQLPKKIPVDYEVNPLFATGNVIDNNAVTFLGYGRTSQEGKDSGILRKTIRDSSGVALISNILKFRAAVCMGDSGGPVFITSQGRVEIMGIVTSVAGRSNDICAETNYAQYVPNHREWISENMANLAF